VSNENHLERDFAELYEIAASKAEGEPRQMISIAMQYS